MSEDLEMTVSPLLMNTLLNVQMALPVAYYQGYSNYYYTFIRYGPLVRYWCMRFEGKHNYFKDLAHRVKCFKNIPKTMALRHQNLMCYHFGTTSNRSPFYKDHMLGPGNHYFVHYNYV